VFRRQLENEFGIAMSPKDPLLVQWQSQKQLLQEFAAQHQPLLSEFEAR